MDGNTIFVRTPKGEDEMRNKSAHLVGDIKRALLMVDGIATFGAISKRAAPSLRSVLDEMFVELERGGFIQDKLAKDKPRLSGVPRMATPHKMAAQPVKRADEGVEELDFTSMFRAPSAEMMAAEAEKLKMAAEAQAHALAEAKAKQQAEAARIRGEAEEKARKEIEAAKLKAQREADEARLKAERDAVK
ncbi:MAG: adenylyl cyclase class-3/4/guanylyl cyclase, partial [uncultured bacterium]